VRENRRPGFATVEKVPFPCNSEEFFQMAMNTLLLIIIIGLIILGVICGYLVPRAWKKRQFAGSLSSLLIMLLMFMTALVILLASAGLKGYKAFTREELAATVSIAPMGNLQFQAKVVCPYKRDTLFALAGDELYMDARILKWKPFVNLLGVHTVYQLDRIAGRYQDIRDERTRVRTVFSLAGARMPWDLFFLLSRFPFLGRVFDAHYGSAAFIPAKDSRVFRVMVTTSGLLIRP
jgi:hypothetical protein